MNTINIYYRTSGQAAELRKDFAMYVGSYQNKLIDVYIPTSILYANENLTYVNSVKIAGRITAPNGVEVTTNPYYLAYLKTVTLAPGEVEDVDAGEYNVYERILPKEFSVYQGNQEIEVNIVSINNTDPDNPVVLQIGTTQTCILPVDIASEINDEPVEDPSEFALLQGQVQTNTQAIQTLNTTVSEHGTAIGQLQGQVEQNTSDIATLQSQIANSENYIGQVTLVADPTDPNNTAIINAQLTTFVENNTSPSREPKNGDVIIGQYELNGAMLTYKFIYGENGWHGYQISQSNVASNGVLGTIKGTYGQGSSNNIVADIQAGELRELYFKNTDNSYSSVTNELQTSVANTATIANMINGNQVVGKATSDADGNVITSTYAKANDVYTKTESDNRYMSKSYSRVYYYSQDGLVDEIPVLPLNGIQFTKNVPTIGEIEFFENNRTLEGDYTFTKDSTDNSALWIFTNTDVTLSFRLLTYIETSGTNYLVASDLSGEYVFTAGVPQEIKFTTIYSGLGNISLETNIGDTFKKVLYVTSANNVATQVNLYSNSQYPSSFQLASQSVNFNINTINNIAQVNILASEWEDNGDNTYSVTIPQTRHQQAPTNQYIMQLQTMISAGTYQYIAFTPVVDNNGNITLTTLQALDCELLIASGTSKDTRGILTLENPTAIPTIDYSESGALRIVQSMTATNLTLPNPTDVGVFYTFMVANDPSSTYNINVNGEEIQVGSGIQFKWVGSWITGEEPTNTTDVYDAIKGQTLNITLSDIESEVATLQTGKQDALTSTQLDAVNSGIDSTKVGQIATNTAAIATKQDALSTTQLEAVNSGANSTNIAQISTNTNDIATNAHNIALNDGAIQNLNTVVATKNVKERAYSAKRDTNLSITPNTETTIAFDTVLYSDEDWFDQSSGSYIILDQAHAMTIKAAVNMSDEAPSAGNVTITIYDDATALAATTKAYSHNETLGQLVVGTYLTSATRNLNVRIEHTFTSNIIVTAETGVSAQVVDQTNKVSASDNAFDIEFGTRWVKNYANNSITLK